MHRLLNCVSAQTLNDKPRPLRSSPLWHTMALQHRRNHCCKVSGSSTPTPWERHDKVRGMSQCEVTSQRVGSKIQFCLGGKVLATETVGQEQNRSGTTSVKSKRPTGARDIVNIVRPNARQRRPCSKLIRLMSTESCSHVWNSNALTRQDQTHGIQCPSTKTTVTMRWM